VALGGDPDEIRGLANMVRGYAADVAVAGRALADTAQIEWTGPAADRFHRRLDEQQADVADVRSTLMDAADALDRLANTLQARQEAIRRAMDAVNGMLSDAGDVLGGLADKALDVLSLGQREAADRARDLLDGVGSLPPLGHPDWLDVAARIGA
jgi:ABC-type transporter Mla subunit MlaD